MASLLFLFKVPTKTDPLNLSLFNKNRDVIFQVHVYLNMQPLDTAS